MLQSSTKLNFDISLIIPCTRTLADRMSKSSVAADIEYAQLSSLSFTDFTPSRATRISSNHLLQEHYLDLSPTGNPVGNNPYQHQEPGSYRIRHHQISPLLPSAVPLQGKYIQVDFSKSSSPNPDQAEYSTIRRPFVNSIPTFFTGDSPGERHQAAASSNADSPVKMARQMSFSIALTEHPIHFDMKVPSPPSAAISTNADHHRNNTCDKLQVDHYCISTEDDLDTMVPSRQHRRLAESPSPLLLGSKNDQFFSSVLESHPARLRSVKPIKETNGSFDDQLSHSGEEIARYTVSYLGQKNIDQYLDIVDECAGQIIDPKYTTKAIEIELQMFSEKIRMISLKTGLSLKSMSISNIMTMNYCSKNRRLIGIVLWKPGTKPTCHLMRCFDSVLPSSVLQSIQYCIEAYHEKSTGKDNQFKGDVSSTLDHVLPSQSFDSIYIGSTKASKHHTINEISHKVLLEVKPSTSKRVEVQMKFSDVLLIHDAKCILSHETNAIQAIGVYQDDKRYMGYIVNDKEQGLIGHVLCCGTTDEIIQLVSHFRQACQISYQKLKCSPEGNEGTATHQKLLSRLRSLAIRSPTSSQSSQLHHSPSNGSPSFQSYVSNHSPYMDIPSKRKDSIVIPSATSVYEFSEEEYVKFSVTYIGTANLHYPFTSHSIVNALDAFKDKGIAAGQAATIKNTIQMYISSLGINLSDRKHKLFVNRNYPRNQIIGCTYNTLDPSYMGVATTRPGFSDQLKLHVFQETDEQLIRQIMYSIEYWLQLKPIT